jgi:hypothetical protein
MSTTALVIEHLIIGLQAAIWLSLLILTAFGWNWINLSVLKDFTTILTFVGLAIVYPIGIFVDELADFALRPWMKGIRKRRFQLEGFEPGDLDLATINLSQKTDDEFLKSYFNYVRMRVRVSRSTALNLALITITSSIFTIVQFHHSQSLMLIIFTEVFVGLLLTALSIWVWREVSDTFTKQTLRVIKANSTIPLK